MLSFIFLYVTVYASIINGCYAHVDGAKLDEECKIADICRHDQVPICGIDSCGEMRTFIDTCDMHEFNCDSRKGKCSRSTFYCRPSAQYVRAIVFHVPDFTQKPAHECWVTCKRGRSFKKAEYGADCDRENLV